MTGHTRTPRLRYVLLGVLAVGGLVFGLMGYVMAGSFGAATTRPTHVEHWSRVAFAYLGVCAGSLVVLAVSLAVVWRRTFRGAVVDSAEVRSTQR